MARQAREGRSLKSVRLDAPVTHPFGAVGARSPARRATRAQRGMAIPLVSQSELVFSAIDA